MVKHNDDCNFEIIVNGRVVEVSEKEMVKCLMDFGIISDQEIEDGVRSVCVDEYDVFSTQYEDRVVHKWIDFVDFVLNELSIGQLIKIGTVIAVS
jgi:hypothetical protein